MANNNNYQEIDILHGDFKYAETATFTAADGGVAGVGTFGRCIRGTYPDAPTRVRIVRKEFNVNATEEHIHSQLRAFRALNQGYQNNVVIGLVCQAYTLLK
jgi:hypothetical protein